MREKTKFHVKTNVSKNKKGVDFSDLNYELKYQGQQMLCLVLPVFSWREETVFPSGVLHIASLFNAHVWALKRGGELGAIHGNR